jgi:hypothetical protein
MGTDLYMAHMLEAQDKYPEVCRQRNALRKALEMALALRTGSFEDGWTMRVTGHQMRSIEAALDGAK